ncbi:MAG: hypothetical protein ACYDCO_21605 [Armatimonadota bacterium]
MATRTAIFSLEGTERPDQAPVGLIDEIRRMPGVLDLTIEPVSETVKLVYDDVQADVEEIRRNLARHGYPTGGMLRHDEGAR